MTSREMDAERRNDDDGGGEGTRRSGRAVKTSGRGHATAHVYCRVCVLCSLKTEEEGTRHDVLFFIVFFLIFRFFYLFLLGVTYCACPLPPLQRKSSRQK